MKLRHLCLLFLLCTVSLLGGAFAPHSFEENELVEELILISDVDGVVRDSIESVADPRVIEAVNALLQNPQISVAFISGTSVDCDRSIEPWRRGNVPLSQVFEAAFTREIAEGRVSIYGISGSHQMSQDGKLEVIDEYSLETSSELSSLLIEAFLQEVLVHGSFEEKLTTKQLEAKLHDLYLKNPLQSPHRTPDEFIPIVAEIRASLDPNFRLICSGASAETHTSHPKWGITAAAKWLEQNLKESPSLSYLPLEQKHPVSGVAKKGEDSFNFLLISKANKGSSSKDHILKKVASSPNALIVTIGDTQIDFPMHRHAHLAFHVGLKKVWENNNFSHCVMVLGENGKDSQHVEGTVRVLEFLKKVLGKSFSDVETLSQIEFTQQN